MAAAPAALAFNLRSPTVSRVPEVLTNLTRTKAESPSRESPDRPRFLAVVVVVYFLATRYYMGTKQYWLLRACLLLARKCYGALLITTP